MGETTAILARTNAALRLPEEALNAAGMRYYLLGHCGFWAAPEIKSCLSYLQCVLYPADYALAGAIRSPFHPAKFLPKTKLLAALKEQHQCETDPGKQAYFNYLVRIPETLVEPKNVGAVREFTAFIHQLSRYRDLPAPDSVKAVLGALKVGDYYAEEESTPDNDPLQNLSELVKLSNKHRTLKEFLDHCRRSTAASKGRKGVCLATCHAAKGTEYDHVYLIGCQEGLMPHSKATDLQEEANIFFVGASRAAKSLTLTYAGQPSIFLKPYMEKKESE